MLSKFHKLMIIGGAIASYSIAAFVGAYTAGQIAWFDPNDLTTMWQDNKGQTVAAVGQPVGLFVEKSQALAPTRVSTWDFSSGTGITPGAGVSVTGGKLVFAAATSTTTATYVPTAGKLYKVTYTISGYSGTGTLSVQLGGLSAAFRSSNGTFVDYLPLTTTVTSLRFIAAASLNASLDDVFIDEIACSAHIEATGTTRPILRTGASGYNYLEFDGVDDLLQVSSLTNSLYGPLLGINYLIVCASKSGASTSALFGPHNSTTAYHRINGSSGSKIATAYRAAAVAAGAAQSVNSAANSTPDNVINVIDSQITTNATIDAGVDNALTSAALLTDTVGQCFFILGNTSMPMNFYGGLSVLTSVSASDRAGLNTYFGALGGLSL